jgi:hypothetical protein
VKAAPVIDENADEDTKYKAANELAKEDPEVQELAKKAADPDLTGEEHKKASRAYTKALFRKMRSIAPSIRERIEATESVILSRLEE